MSKHNVSRVMRQRTTADVYDIRTGAAVARTPEEIRAAFLRKNVSDGAPLCFRSRVHHIAAIDPRVSDAAFRVLFIQSCYGNPDGSKIYPAVGTVASLMGCGERTIERANASLDRAGYQTSVRRQCETTIRALAIPDDVLVKIASEIAKVIPEPSNMTIENRSQTTNLTPRNDKFDAQPCSLDPAPTPPSHATHVQSSSSEMRPTVATTTKATDEKIGVSSEEERFLLETLNRFGKTAGVPECQTGHIMRLDPQWRGLLAQRVADVPEWRTAIAMLETARFPHKHAKGGEFAGQIGQLLQVRALHELAAGVFASPEAKARAASAATTSAQNARWAENIASAIASDRAAFVRLLAEASNGGWISSIGGNCPSARFGPMPGKPGCVIPADVIAEAASAADADRAWRAEKADADRAWRAEKAEAARVAAEQKAARAADNALRGRIDMWCAARIWHADAGPRPDQPGFAIPEHIASEYAERLASRIPERMDMVEGVHPDFASTGRFSWEKSAAEVWL
jgi:hypothetical protein